MKILIGIDSMISIGVLCNGSLEEWHVSNQRIRSYFSVIGFTIWVVLGFSFGLVWKLFKDLPAPPEELDKWM